jgi:hypothetical protein
MDHSTCSCIDYMHFSYSHFRVTSDEQHNWNTVVMVIEILCISSMSLSKWSFLWKSVFQFGIQYTLNTFFVLLHHPSLILKFIHRAAVDRSNQQDTCFMWRARRLLGHNKQDLCYGKRMLHLSMFVLHEMVLLIWRYFCTPGIVTKLHPQTSGAQ